jgi:hypothetical protein
MTTVNLALSQLRLGEFTTITSTARSGGIPAAVTVERLGIPAATWRKLRPAFPSPPAGLPAASLAPSPPAVKALRLNGLGCAPAAVTTSYLLTAASG